MKCQDSLTLHASISHNHQLILETSTCVYRASLTNTPKYVRRYDSHS
jgi:hypothetical protein